MKCFTFIQISLREKWIPISLGWKTIKTLKTFHAPQTGYNDAVQNYNFIITTINTIRFYVIHTHIYRRFSFKWLIISILLHAKLQVYNHGFLSAFLKSLHLPYFIPYLCRRFPLKFVYFLCMVYTRKDIIWNKFVNNKFNVHFSINISYANVKTFRWRFFFSFQCNDNIHWKELSQ